MNDTKFVPVNLLLTKEQVTKSNYFNKSSTSSGS